MCHRVLDSMTMYRACQLQAWRRRGGDAAMRRRQPQFGTTMADLEPGPPADDAKRHCKSDMEWPCCREKGGPGPAWETAPALQQSSFPNSARQRKPSETWCRVLAGQEVGILDAAPLLLCSFATSRYDCAYRGIRAGTGGGLSHAQGTSNAHPRDQGTEDVQCKEVEHAQTRCTVDDGWLLAGLALWGADGAEAS